MLKKLNCRLFMLILIAIKILCIVNSTSLIPLQQQHGENDDDDDIIVSRLSSSSSIITQFDENNFLNNQTNNKDEKKQQNEHLSNAFNMVNNSDNNVYPAYHNNNTQTMVNKIDTLLLLPSNTTSSTTTTFSNTTSSTSSTASTIQHIKNLNGVNNRNLNKKKKMFLLNGNLQHKPNFSLMASSLLNETKLNSHRNRSHHGRSSVYKIPTVMKRNTTYINFTNEDLVLKKQAIKLNNNNISTTTTTTSKSSIKLPTVMSTQLSSSNDLNFEFNSLNNHIRVSFIEFDFLINDFIDFEPKTGFIDLNAKLKYKWWINNINKNEQQFEQIQSLKQIQINNKNNTYSNTTTSNFNFKFDRENTTSTNRTTSNNARSMLNNVQTDTINANEPDLHEFIYPKIEFKNENLIKFEINNQLHKIENYEEYYEQNKLTELSSYSSHVAERLFSLSNANAKSANVDQVGRKTKRKYSYLEQNANVKFKCSKHSRKSSTSNTKENLSEKTDNDEYDGVDVSYFPFDVHKCTLEFDLIANLNENYKDKDKEIIPIYVFPQISITETFSDDLTSSKTNFNQIDYNKLVKNEQNNTLFSHEWILKNVYIKYFNSTSTLFMPNLQYTAKNISNTNDDTTESVSHGNDESTDDDVDDAYSLNDYIMALSLSSDKKLRRKRNTEQASVGKRNNVNPAKVSIDFLIYRRREPQIYLFVLPLVILTLITFLIFFIPTTHSGEKSLIALLNCAFLLIYNIYAFKLIIFSYNVLRIPLILKYSNCLMIIQLAVLAYTCLVKSIYLNGFLTFSSRTYLNDTEDLYNQITSYQHQQASNEIEIKADTMTKKPYNNNNNNNNAFVKSKQINSIYDSMNGNGNGNMAQIVKLDELTGCCNGKTIEQQINTFTACNNIVGAATNTASATLVDESNYTVYNNIDAACDCSAHETDADCIQNATRDENNYEEHNTNNNVNNINSCSPNGTLINPPNGLNVTSTMIKNEYGMISDYNKSENMSAILMRKNTRKNSSNSLFRFICSKFNQIFKAKDDHEDYDESFSKMHSSNCKTQTTGILPEYDYTCHLSRNAANMSRKKTLQQNNDTISTFKRVSVESYLPTLAANKNNNNKVDVNQTSDSGQNTPRNLSFVIKPNTKTTQFLAPRNVDSGTTNVAVMLNTHLKQLVKFEEINLKERLIREEWKRKARFCDGICCLFIFFILITCSICIFAILPAFKITSMVD